MTSEWAIRVRLTEEEKKKLNEAMETIKLLRDNIYELTKLTDGDVFGVRELSEAIDVIKDVIKGNVI